MKLTLLSTAICLTLAPSVVLAASSSTYRGELDLNYINDEDDVDTGQIGFKWYFQPVTSSFKKMFKKTINHPLAEAAFLEKASSLSIKYNAQHFDEPESFKPNRLANESLELDLESLELDLSTIDKLDLSTTKTAIDYFIPNSIFYVGIQYNRTTIKTSDNNDDNVKSSNWGLTGGIMIADNFLLSTTYEDGEDYKPNCNGKYVTELSGGAAVNFMASYSRLSEDKSNPSIADEAQEKKNKDLLSVSSDYYFDRTFSIGTGLLYSDKTGYELRAQKFFSDAVSANIMFRTYDDSNVYAVGISARL